MAEKLRSKTGCPWDLAQTIVSMHKCLENEAHEMMWQKNKQKERQEPLKNDAIQGNKELTTELYEPVQRGGSDEVDAELGVFQRFPNKKKDVRTKQTLGNKKSQ